MRNNEIHTIRLIPAGIAVTVPVCRHLYTSKADVNGVIESRQVPKMHKPCLKKVSTAGSFLFIKVGCLNNATQG